MNSIGGSRGGGGGAGGPDPLKNAKNLGFLSNTEPDVLKITKLLSQHSISGCYQPASEMPFKWHFDGGSMRARL